MPLNDRLLARMTMSLPDAGVRWYGKLQARLYRFSGGRFGGRFGEGPVLVLTTTGRRSGKPRCTSVLYGKDRDCLVVIGSNTGSERHPAWALNLATHPEAVVQIGREQKRVRASEATNDERARLWELMSEQYGGFDVYTTKTARELKVFILTPV